ncbi:protein of unknown function DUF296 [Macleaya cordata]|uniref:PPC domain-containing protein n=1 Tax=Macleaya cordata TaxID=56857 RepID=A0A200R745_MACCD|nr:protein of unknown function DUF296 [Macleaya cordata]
MAEYGGISLSQARECSSEEDQEAEEQISPRSGAVIPVMIGGGGSSTSSGVTKTKINNKSGRGGSGGGGGGRGGGGGDFDIGGSGTDHHHQMMMTPTNRKPRGRPPGSKNKPKPPIIITRESDSSMQPLILEVSAGSDLVEMVSDFARRRHVGLSILSGSGSVANVTLRHPSSHNTTLSISGRFEILSLSGSFLSPPPSSSSSKSSSSSHHHQPPFAITLAGGQGQVIGGTVAGPLIAATPVVLMAASFINPNFYRLPCEDQEDEGHHDQDVKPSKLGGGGGSGGGGNDQSCSPASMSVSVYSVGVASNPLNCQIPSDVVLPWPPTSSRPPPPY